MILGDVAAYHHIEGKSHGGTIQRGNREYPPGPQGLQNGPEERRVFRQDVLDGLHLRINSPQGCRDIEIESLNHRIIESWQGSDTP